ncbi:hypothetical protein I7I48_01458 [Histoplasma ohiense]|nr:hypothetical protein I7I48_01458 [Histoplasma ohiense (nom. inval.)]
MISIVFSILLGASLSLPFSFPPLFFASFLAHFFSSSLKGKKCKTLFQTPPFAKYPQSLPTLPENGLGDLYTLFDLPI